MRQRPLALIGADIVIDAVDRRRRRADTGRRARSASSAPPAPKRSIAAINWRQTGFGYARGVDHLIGNTGRSAGSRLRLGARRAACDGISSMTLVLPLSGLARGFGAIGHTPTSMSQIECQRELPRRSVRCDGSKPASVWPPLQNGQAACASASLALTGNVS